MNNKERDDLLHAIKCYVGSAITINSLKNHLEEEGKNSEGLWKFIVDTIDNNTQRAREHESRN